MRLCVVDLALKTTVGGCQQNVLASIVHSLRLDSVNSHCVGGALSDLYFILVMYLGSLHVVDMNQMLS